MVTNYNHNTITTLTGTLTPNYCCRNMCNDLFNAKELDEENGMYYYSARYYNPPIFISRDPLFEKYPWMSPYAYCSNNPINRIDPTGMEDSPIYDQQGNLLGTDDQGLQGKAIIMDKSNFKQGMSHKEALQHSLGYEGLKDDAAKAKFNESYNGLPNRPDYDGHLTLSEANDWYRNGDGQPLYVDASKIDLSPVYKGDIKEGETRSPNYASPRYANRATGLVYGQLSLTGLNSEGAVRIGNTSGLIDNYGFEMHSGGITFRNVATTIGKINAGNGQSFDIFGYGTGQLKQRPTSTPRFVPPMYRK
jgi:RHS repeat-associated protein